MPHFTTVRRVPYSQPQMFDIVADVERYPEFLPMCDRLEVIKRFEQQGYEMLHALMEVGYLGLRESFVSQVTLNRRDMKISTVALEGPFTHLENHWQFQDLGASHTDIHFTIDYKFKNWPMEKLMGAMFDKAFKAYAASFEERAKALAKEKQPS